MAVATADHQTDEIIKVYGVTNSEGQWLNLGGEKNIHTWYSYFGTNMLTTDYSEAKDALKHTKEGCKAILCNARDDTAKLAHFELRRTK